MIPRSGAQYAFFTDSFGPLHKFWGPLPAFVYAFTEVLVSQPCGIAIVALTSAEYLVESLLYLICVEGEVVWLKRLIAIMEICKLLNVRMADLHCENFRCYDLREHDQRQIVLEAPKCLHCS